MKQNYRKLGEYIEVLDRRNSDLTYGLDYVRGISNTKEITPTKAFVDETVISKFYVINPGEFVYNPRTTRMGDKVGLALNNTNTPLLFTFNNLAFRIKDVKKKELLPEFLYLFFCRSEFDRYARVNSWGSATELFLFDALCELELPVPTLSEQQHIVNAYNTVNHHIILLKQINEKLEATAQQIYKDAISDSSKWKDGTINDVIVLHDSKRIPLGSDERINMKKIYPYYGAAALMDYVDNYIFDGRYLLLGEDGTVMDEKGYPILQYVEGKIWVNNHAHVLTGKNGYSIELLYLLFKNTDVREIVTGAVQLKINQENLKNIPIKIIDSTILKQLDSKIQPIFSIIRFQTKTIEKLELFKEIIISKISKM